MSPLRLVKGKLCGDGFWPVQPGCTLVLQLQSPKRTKAVQSTILSLDNGLKSTYYNFNQLLNIVPSYGTPMRHQQSIRAISPGLGFVDILAKSPDGLHLTEIVRRACLSGNQTHHLLETLIQEGLVTQDGNL